MINRNVVADLQGRVTKTSCPSCGEPHLSFQMRCDLGGETCLFLARCGRCQSAFELDAEFLPEGLTADSLQEGHVLCPECDDAMALVSFECVTSSHSCRYTLRCPRCNAS